jgi:hypothetical protein
MLAKSAGKGKPKDFMALIRDFDGGRRRTAVALHQRVQIRFVPIRRSA